MTNLPTQPDRSSPPPILPPGTTTRADDEVRLHEVWAVLRRNRWLVLTLTLLVTAAAGWLTYRAVPVYESETALRIEDRQPAVPELLRPLSGESEVSTEMEILGSRTLVEDAVAELGLQAVLAEPRRVSRGLLVDSLVVDREAEPAIYVLERRGADRFAVLLDETDVPVAEARVGRRVSFGGVSLTLLPAAAAYDRLELAVSRFQSAVAATSRRIDVARAARDARIVNLTYRDSDPTLAAAVPNLIASRFVDRRREMQRATTASTIRFLREQLDTLAVQLADAETELLKFRERERVVNPVIEGSTQITQFMEMQTERSMLDAERAALARLLREVRTAAAQKAADEPSPYRNLLAFPTLLKNGAASELLQSLATVEDQRNQLLVRRTPRDPDVQNMTTRVTEIERELRSIAETYLQGLTHQVASIDSTLNRYGARLQQVPQRELQYTRLERQPKLLQELFALLQTRLKEAEIAQAAVDLSVQVVDPAVTPRTPISPRPAFNLGAGLLLGLLLGSGAAFLRELLDKSVHTRADVYAITGLPVVGFIPRIPRPRSGPALISERGVRRRSGPRVTPVFTASRRRRPGSRIVHRPDTLPNGRPETGAGTAPAEPSTTGSGQSSEPEARLDLSEAGAPAAEAFGSLQTNLVYSVPDTPPRLIVFTSALPGDGKTTTTVNLALALTQRGRRVLLIDADLRRGTVHLLLETSREPGLSDVLRGGLSLEAARRTVAVGAEGVLEYLTTGALPPNPTGMVESEAMRVLLARAREVYDAVIVDSPPMNVVTDAALLGLYADGVVLVARSGVTHGAALGYAMEQLRHVQARVLGVVLNDIDFDRDAAYDPAYRYYRYDQYYKTTSA